MKLTLVEMVIYLIQNGYVKGQTAALELMGLREGLNAPRKSHKISKFQADR